jgi:hypothetical protein
MAFAKNEAFGASQALIRSKDARQDDDASDGGFFEE